MSEEWNQEEKKAEETAGAGEVHKEEKKCKKNKKGTSEKRQNSKNGTAANISTKTQVGDDWNEHIRVQ